MTDARLGARLPAIVAAMPPRSAVVLRPYAMRREGRASTIRAIRRAARAKRHLLLLAGGGPVAGYDGRHGGRRASGTVFLSRAVHDTRERAEAVRERADAVLISPVLPTRSHPGAATLGRRGFARLAHGQCAPAIALGGMDTRSFGRLRYGGAHGWAAIDAWEQLAVKHAR